MKSLNYWLFSRFNESNKVQVLDNADDVDTHNTQLEKKDSVEPSNQPLLDSFPKLKKSIIKVLKVNSHCVLCLRQ